MTDVDWTTVISNLGSTTGLAGVIGTIVVAVLYTRKQKHPKADETRAVAQTSTPVSPGTGPHDAEAYDLARLAMKKANSLSDRLTAMEGELRIMKRSYDAAYWWIQWVRGPAWDELRDNTNPPAEPQGIHHPK